MTRPTCLHAADLFSHSPRACTPWEWMTEIRCSRTMVHGATAPAACRFDLWLSTEEKKNGKGGGKPHPLTGKFDYQLALVTPGIRPFEAISRN